MSLIFVQPNTDRWLSLENLPNEEWKDIKDFEGLYQISNYGRVKRLQKILKSYLLNHNTNVLKPKICRCQLKHDKYLGVVLTKNGKKYNKQIHRLVAQTFIPNPENKPCVNHIKPVLFNYCDNRVCNLEWCTKSENTQHMLTLGRNNNGSKIRMYNCDGKHCMSKIILKIDFNNQIVKRYGCVKECIKDLGFSKSKCYNILKNTIEVGGYRYVYEDKFK